ncbi:MAG: hypothetical protein ACREQL_12945 [Candidatus Binatia bacterium]
MTTTKAALLALALGASLTAAAPATAAKRCRLLCRDAIRACVADARAHIPCTGLRGHDRRACQRDLHAAIRTCKRSSGPILQACKASTSVDACSPSGAFLDGELAGS